MTNIAKFNPLYRPYLVLIVGLTLIATIIGIPLAIIWFCGVGQWWARHYFDKLECHLSDKALRFRKGILFQIEKTIPLENIQDVTFIEGPVLRRFHLSKLKFETAGHSADQASHMELIGIIDAHEFRNQILTTRDALKQQHTQPYSLLPSATQAADSATLQGIEQRLDQIIELLKARQ